MPSWGEIQDFARSKYKLMDDQENWFSLVFRWGEDNRSQKIIVRKFTAFNIEWVEFRSVVCSGEQLPPKVALRKNDDLAVGALALDSDGDYVLLHCAPLPTMDPEEFELPLHVIASTADELEKQYSDEDKW